MQNNLHSDDVTIVEARKLFSYRTRMSNYSGNFGGVKLCPLCEAHNDVQKISFQCTTIKENVKISGCYSHIFSENISSDIVQTVSDFEKFRQDYMDNRMLQWIHKKRNKKTASMKATVRHPAAAD